MPTNPVKIPKISVKTVDEIEGLWSILNVSRWGQEFSIQEHLKREGVETFIAQQRIKREVWVKDSRYRDGGYYAKRLITASYFPTYFFAAIKDDTERHRVIEARKFGMEAILDVHETDQLDLISRLRSLEIAYQINPLMPQGTWSKKVGDTVEITSGAFRGMKGEIVKIGGKDRLHVGIRTLGQPVELDIDPSECELIQ